MLRSRLLLIFAFLGIYTMSGQSFAQDQVAGHIVKASGRVLVARIAETDREPLAAGDTVYLRDTVHTGADGQVEIRMMDETVIKMAGEGLFAIEDYFFDPARPEEGKAHFRILRAAFEYVSGKIGKGQANPDVRLDIDFGSIGIRGTRFVRAMEDGTCWIYLEEGIIRVSNKGGYITLDAGQGTKISGPAVPPALPQNWVEDDYQWIKNKLDF